MRRGSASRVAASPDAARPWRLAYLVSHPIQYQAPLLRLVAGLETEAPAIEADDVVLRFVGRDGAGAWRVVLFNDSERPAAVRVAVNGDYEIRDAGTGAISPIARPPESTLRPCRRGSASRSAG